MSVAALAAEIRRAVAAVPLATLDQVDQLLTDAQSALEEAARGSSAAELAQTISGMNGALVQVRAARQAAVEASQLFERYLAHLGVGGSANAAPTAPTPVATARPPRKPLSPGARKLVDEVQERGDKISPDKVVRIEKPHRIVWLEEGDERAGLTHILTEKRVADFARHGIGRDEIVDAVFTALTDGEAIGITGRDRVVYAVVYRGRPVRIAVSVGNNGFIVGANPFSLNQKVKPLP